MIRCRQLNFKNIVLTGVLIGLIVIHQTPGRQFFLTLLSAAADHSGLNEHSAKKHLPHIRPEKKGLLRRFLAAPVSHNDVFPLTSYLLYVPQTCIAAVFHEIQFVNPPALFTPAVSRAPPVAL